MSKSQISVVKRLKEKGLISPPSFVSGGVQYETMMGSVAYGVSSDTSDTDIYGFCIPPKGLIFPHLDGYIADFSTQIPKFEQYQEHHIKEKDTNKEYDLNIYSIVKYFRLCMGNNPNMIDSLFTARNMVLSSSRVSDMVRDSRKLFLHKGSWHKFKGYAYSQMHKMKIKEPDVNSVRYEMVQKYGYDVKFGYHVVRLLDEVEQILLDGDIDLMRNREQLKSIRRGDWLLSDIEAHFNEKEKILEKAYVESKLRHKPEEALIKDLLLNCLEEHYGSLKNVIESKDKYEKMIQQIKIIIE